MNHLMDVLILFFVSMTGNKSGTESPMSYSRSTRLAVVLSVQVQEVPQGMSCCVVCVWKIFEKTWMLNAKMFN